MLADGGKEDWKQFTRLLSLCSAHELRSRIEATLTTLRASDQTGASTSTSSSLILFLEQLRRLEETGGTSKSPNAKEPSVFVAQGNKKLDKFELKAVSTLRYIPFFMFMRLLFLFIFTVNSNC